MQEKISCICQAASLSDKCGILLTGVAAVLSQLTLGTHPHQTQLDQLGKIAQLSQNGILTVFIFLGLESSHLQTCFMKIKYVGGEGENIQLFQNTK